MNSGFFLIDKEEGVSSAFVVSRLKKKFNLKKVGHTGTLDPFATGLLICPVNSATRLSSFIVDSTKVYSGTILFGIKTDSDDITGNVISESKSINLTFEDLLKAKDTFLGNIKQVPPKLSAIKINGQRAYDKFRKNEDFEMQEREVQVSSFDILSFDGLEATFRITCSKGTYIRAISRDLGEKLGVPSCLKTLRREKTGKYDVKNAKSVKEISESDIIKWYEIFDDSQRLELESSDIKRLNIGDNIFLEKLAKSEGYKEKFKKYDILYYLGDKENELSGILIKKDNTWNFLVNRIF